MPATLLKKMGSKQIMNNVKEVVKTIENDGGKKTLFRVWGQANGFKTGEHATNGAWVCFEGRFGALNMITGEEFSSAKCFLPEPMPGMLHAALKTHDSVEFVLEVDAVRRDSLAVGYEYLVRPLIEAKEADPLAHLKATALPVTTTKALDAPTPETEAGPETEAAPESPKGKKGKAA